jgi:sporulation protein YlmC with PRC-barrel domain
MQFTPEYLPHHPPLHISNNNHPQAMVSFSTSKIIGSIIYDERDQQIGTIHDIMVNINGSISYIIFSYHCGGGTMLGDKCFAIPFDAFFTRHNDGAIHLILKANRNILENAPGFDKNYMPNFADPAFANRIDKYYKEYQCTSVPA